MTSNCYVVYDEDTKKCLVIDPASEKAEDEISFICIHSLSLEYIMLTHEHTDHTWGTNALKEQYPDAKILCSEACNKYAPKASRAYFLFYFDDPNYRYTIKPADVIVKDGKVSTLWNGCTINFIITPGHSYGSMCIEIDGMLFTGDTLMPFPAYFNGRDSNEEDWERSVALIESKYSDKTLIYPGHGDVLTLGEWKKKYYVL